MDRVKQNGQLYQQEKNKYARPAKIGETIHTLSRAGNPEVSVPIFDKNHWVIMVPGTREVHVKDDAQFRKETKGSPGIEILGDANRDLRELDFKQYKFQKEVSAVKITDENLGDFSGINVAGKAGVPPCEPKPGKWLVTHDDKLYTVENDMFKDLYLCKSQDHQMHASKESFDQLYKKDRDRDNNAFADFAALRKEIEGMTEEKSLLKYESGLQLSQEEMEACVKKIEDLSQMLEKTQAKLDKLSESEECLHRHCTESEHQWPHTEDVDWVYVKKLRGLLDDEASKPKSLFDCVDRMSEDLKRFMECSKKKFHKTHCIARGSALRAVLKKFSGECMDSFVAAYTAEHIPVYSTASGAFHAEDRLSHGEFSEQVLRCAPFYVGLNEELLQMPVVGGGDIASLTLWRGVKFPFPDLEGHFAKGRIVMFYEPKSASENEDKARAFSGKQGTLFKIKVRKAYKISHKSFFKEEEEVLIPMFSAFVVQEVVNNRDKSQPDCVVLLQLSDEKVAAAEQARSSRTEDG